ncbi:DUF1146 family protein [Bacillus sp. B-TM1]
MLVALKDVPKNRPLFTITWWALQGLHIERLMKPGKVMQTRVLLILVTIAIGTSVSNFFLDYLGYSKSLTYLVK